ncbi:ABC transporter substrate-binding protein [Alsobacter sp. SYSU M60028]|uniref:ABC transporter substrate-binding protein n=1 Tax=Alsobacter ponti TaxID=2962936 RepID=A0ABT1LEU1_9HYPH|nr:ABC transporter substrate-binding protein [Alsobacter ponti]MCP8939628.1 ABC transporter substrate-binding protein [Alsobacter ponti]
MTLRLAKPTRRIAAGLFAATLALGVASVAQAQEKLRLIVTELTTPLVPNSVMTLAKSAGYYDRAGVDVELVRVSATPSAIAALSAGQGDMANVAVDTTLQLIARGQVKGKAVLSPDRAIPFMIVSKAGIGSVKDLAGKTFGVSRLGSVDHLLSVAVLRALGADVDKIELVAIGDPAARALAAQAGRVDATSFSIGVWTDLRQKADTANLKVLVPQAEYFKAAPLISKVNLVTDEVAKSKAKAIAAFTKANLEAARDFHKNPKLWADAMAKERPDVSRATLDELAVLFKDSWSVNGGMNLKQLAYTQAELYKGPDFRDLRPVTLEEWVDTRPVDAALKDVGIMLGLDDTGR